MAASGDDPSGAPSTPSPFNYILSFLLVGICWGFTTPFIRKAAINYTPPSNPSITDPNRSWVSRQILKAFFTVVGLLKSPRYAVPLLLNLTGSIWFFLLVGQAGMFLQIQIVSAISAAARCLQSLTNAFRTLSYGPNHKFLGFPLYCSGRVVCGGQAHLQRYWAGNDPCLRRHWAMCMVQNLMTLVSRKGRRDIMMRCRVYI